MNNRERREHDDVVRQNSRVRWEILEPVQIQGHGQDDAQEGAVRTEARVTKQRRHPEGPGPR